MITYLLFGLLACQETEKNGGFSSDGTLPNTSSSGNAGNNPTNEPSDTQINGSENPDAPFITQLDAYFSNFQGLGDVLEVHAMYTDVQDDLENGLAYVAYSSPSGSENFTVPIDGTNALIEEGEITIVFQDVDTNSTYDFTVSLEDAAGNRSNEETATAVPNGQ